MTWHIHIPNTILLACAALALSACGGDSTDGGGSTATYTVGGKVTGLTGSGLMLSNNGGDNLSVTANGEFKFRSALAKGMAYNVAAATQPTNPSQNCVVRNGTGNGTIAATDVTTVAVVCNNVGRFAYMANAGSNDVSAYTIDASTGALTAVAGSPFLAGSLPLVVTLHPSGRFAYVANGSSNNISAYAIDADTGVLTQVAGSPFATGASPFVATIDPSGRFAYVANQISTTVSAYSIDATTGALTAVAGGPYAVGNFPVDVVIDPGGKFVYVTNYGTAAVGTWSGGGISAYSINASSGALSSVAGSPFAVGACPCVFTLHPSGKFAYVANNGGGTVSTYTINATTGGLTPVSSTSGGFCPVGPPPDVPSTCGVTIDPSGKFAYVANWGDGSNPAIAVPGVLAFSINATTGALAPVAGSPFAAGTSPTFITIDPSGKFAYVADPGDATVSAYSIDAASGALTAVAGSPFPAGPEPSVVELDPSGKFAYVANGASADVSAYPIEGYSIDATSGALTAVPGSPFAAGIFGGTPAPRVVVSN